MPFIIYYPIVAMYSAEVKLESHSFLIKFVICDYQIVTKYLAQVKLESYCFVFSRVTCLGHDQIVILQIVACLIFDINTQHFSSSMRLEPEPRFANTCRTHITF